MAKKIDFKNMTVSELNNALEQAARDLYKIRLDSAAGQLKTPHVINAKRKDIARMKTAICLVEKKDGAKAKEQDGKESAAKEVGKSVASKSVSKGRRRVVARKS